MTTSDARPGSNMDVEIKESVYHNGTDPADHVEPNDTSEMGTIKPLLQNVSVRGASLPRLQSWNSCLIGLSIALGVAQVIVSVLVIVRYTPEEDWLERCFWPMDIWFPEVFGAVIGVILGIMCRDLLRKISKSTTTTHKVTNFQHYQRHYIPWKGAPVTSRMKSLSIILVPTLLSFPLFVVSVVSFCYGVRMLTSVDLTGEDADYSSKDYSSFIVCLCIHFFILLAKIAVLVLHIVIPGIIATIANHRFGVISNYFYPFALFLNGAEFSKPLLIEP